MLHIMCVHTNYTGIAIQPDQDTDPKKSGYSGPVYFSLTVVML